MKIDEAHLLLIGGAFNTYKSLGLQQTYKSLLMKDMDSGAQGIVSLLGLKLRETRVTGG